LSGAGERCANQGATNRTNSRTDAGAAQATVAGAIAASRQRKHTDCHRQINSNAFHDGSPFTGNVRPSGFTNRYSRTDNVQTGEIDPRTFNL
jgi:hypothetical protein